MNNRKKIWAHLALLGTNIFFAINFSAVKYLINEKLILPFGLNLSRMLGATILLWVFQWIKPIKQPIQKIHQNRFLLCALLGIALNQLLFIKGLSMTYSIHASLLMLTTPLFIMLIAAAVLKEKLTRYKWGGLTLGITGAIVLILSRKNTGDGMNVWLGDLLVVINAISYSYYFVLVKPLMKRYHPITVIRTVFTYGTLMALPFCLIEFLQTPWQDYQFMDLGILSLIIIGGTFLAYLFNLFGIKYLGASISGSYIYSQPVFASIIAILFMGESLDAYKLTGAVLIFMGVYLTNKTQDEPDQA
jgi:drug/metabolite transporter (DMT)-like permease